DHGGHGKAEGQLSQVSEDVDYPGYKQRATINRPRKKDGVVAGIEQHGGKIRNQCHGDHHHEVAVEEDQREGERWKIHDHECGEASEQQVDQKRRKECILWFGHLLTSVADEMTPVIHHQLGFDDSSEVFIIDTKDPESFLQQIE